MDNVGNITHLHFESTALQPGSADAQHYIDHLQAACDADRAWAHVELAREYFSGQYTEKDSEYAYTLLQTLFDMPSEDFGTYQARGKLLLAEHLLNGTNGLPVQDGAHVLQLLQDAASQGENDALLRLLDLYAQGHKRLGIKSDEKQATHWAAQAVAAGILTQVEAQRRTYPNDHKEGLGRSILYHILFGPFALVWTVLVAIFGKRLLKRLILGMLAIFAVLAALILAAALLDSSKDSSASSSETFSSKVFT